MKSMKSRNWMTRGVAGMRTNKTPLWRTVTHEKDGLK